uniref:Regulatory factor X-associated protein n=1 Tax=Gasterosteus aculeatus aculeatus TaxID=481459 RepID=A0AAQ4NXI8_GASAC
MSEDDNSASANKDKDSTLLLTKDGQRYYVSKSGVVDSRNVITPLEPDNNVSSYDMDDPDEESDVLDTSDPRDSAASPEELNDEDTSEGDNAPKQCTYEGCTETTTQVAKQRKPWMCKKHRNKMYKDKYKKKKSDQAMSSGKIDVRLCSRYSSFFLNLNLPSSCERYCEYRVDLYYTPSVNVEHLESCLCLWPLAILNHNTNQAVLVNCLFFFVFSPLSFLSG